MTNKNQNSNQYGFPVVYQKNLVADEKYIKTMTAAFKALPEEEVENFAYLVAGWYRLKSHEEGIQFVKAVRDGQTIPEAFKALTAAKRKPKTAAELVDNMTPEQLAELEAKIVAIKAAAATTGLVEDTAKPVKTDTVKPETVKPAKTPAKK